MKTKIYINKFLFFIILIFQILISKEKLHNIKNLNSFSEIILTIRGRGDQYIISNNSIDIFSKIYTSTANPDKILINGIPQNYTGKIVYGLEKEENEITLIFNNLLTQCNTMFYDLNNIIKIDLSKFDSSEVTEMIGMFYSCISLTSINFEGFNTKSLISMDYIFYNCTKITSLNLQNFETSSVTNMTGIFGYCQSLLSIDLSNFDTSSVTQMVVMFHSCISLKSIDLQNFDTSSVVNFHGMFKHCSSLISLNIDNFNTRSANNMNHMFMNCTSLISLNIKHFNTTKINNIYDMFTDTNNKTILCIDEQNRLITDAIKARYKNYTNICSDVCFTNKTNNKFIKDKNLCISECYEDDKYKIEYENLCYDICPKNTHISSSMTCEKDLIPDWDINNFFNGIILKNNISLEEKEEIITKIQNDIQNGNINLTNLISGDKKDLIVKEKDTSFQITTTENQNEEKYEDISTIQLGKCEEILKEKYKIDKHQPLIIFKIDYFVPGILIPVIGYDVFHPENKSKLDLNYCKDAIANFKIPVTLNESNLIKYDPYNEYYTDECYSYTTEDGTDILLKDRHYEYNNNNYSLCEKNCSFVEYNKDTKKAVCGCDINSKEIMISKIIDEENILSTHDFKNRSSFSNIKTMKCVYTVFSKEGLSKNIGNYILLFIILAFSILGILFYKVGYELILSEIDLIIEFEEQKAKNDSHDILVYSNINKTEKKQKKDFAKKKRKSKKSISNLSKTKSSTKIISFSKIDLKSNKNIKTMEKIKKNLSNNNNNIHEVYNDYELNTLPYEKALVKDNRTLIQYYISLIKAKHPLIFSFVPIKDYNSFLIKISLFLLFFSILYIINALFFNESTIHQIYADSGIYNLVFFMPKIFLSFLFSHIIYIFIKYFFLSERNLAEIKKFYKSPDKISSMKKGIVIKYICYFSIGSAFLIFFWYYLSSFCAVFKNSQIYLIKNTFISLG